MAGLLVLIPAITETLVIGGVVVGALALSDMDDQAATSGDPQPEELEDAAFEAPGFDAGAEQQAVGTASKLALPTEDDDFSTMVLAALPKVKVPPKPIQPPKPIPKPVKKISIVQEAAAKVAHVAMKAAIDYLASLAGVGDQMATLVNFLNQADATLLLTKSGVDLQSIVGKVSGANDQLLNFMKQMSDPNWVTQHITSSIDPKLLKLGINAWTTFVKAL